MYKVKEVNYEGYNISICIDESAINPRECDNLGEKREEILQYV